MPQDICDFELRARAKTQENRTNRVHQLHETRIEKSAGFPVNVLEGTIGMQFTQYILHPLVAGNAGGKAVKADSLRRELTKGKGNEMNA